MNMDGYTMNKAIRITNIDQRAMNIDQRATNIDQRATKVVPPAGFSFRFLSEITPVQWLLPRGTCRFLSVYVILVCYMMEGVVSLGVSIHSYRPSNRALQPVGEHRNHYGNWSFPNWISAWKFRPENVS